MATYGIPGTATYSVTFPTLDAMLASVPDNNRQAIGATAVRNSLFTLWTAASSGVQGPQGSIGLQGSQGLIGVGSQGNQGLNGPQGVQGLQGTQGVQGAQGVGYTGSVGTQGVIGPTGHQGAQGVQGPGITGSQGSQGVIGNQGVKGDFGPTGSGYIIGYSIAVQMINGFPDTNPSTLIIGASSSDGVILHNGSSWVKPGWSNSVLGTNYSISINHPFGTKVLNLTTHGVNSTNVYSIAAYGKSPAGTQYCTLVQSSTFSSFTLYGISYMATSCAQSGTTQVVVTFQAQT